MRTSSAYLLVREVGPLGSAVNVGLPQLRRRFGAQVAPASLGVGAWDVDELPLLLRRHVEEFLALLDQHQQSRQ